MSKHKYIGLVPKTLQALVQCQAQLYILHFGSFSYVLSCHAMRSKKVG